MRRAIPLSIDAIAERAFDFAVEVEGLFQALCRSAGGKRDEESGLGGKLLYAGELGGAGRALMVAGNIAGVATLGATADPAAQKQAIRDGVADFRVTSLDEALRILKNEIRKRETVAVCVADAPEAVEREMLDRGVLPDLLPPLSWVGASFGDGSQRIAIGESGSSQELIASALIVWSIAVAPARWLPKLDALALDALSGHASCGRRWLRLAPRYLGRLAQGLRVMRAQPEAAYEFILRVQNAVSRGDICVPVRISLNHGEKVFVVKPDEQTE
jgi:urocanate hydratase